MTTLPSSVQTLIVGAGFAGLAAATTVLRDDPNADVPTSLYSFSFAPSAKWSHTFARQPEIYRYLNSVVDDTGLRQRLVTGCALLSAKWDAAHQTWQVQTSSGDLTALVALPVPRLHPSEVRHRPVAVDRVQTAPPWSESNGRRDRHS